MEKNLLIVDDEIELREGLAELLSDAKARIYTAANGLAALRIMEDVHIDCVVTDVKMPVMDGIKLIQAARSKGLESEFIFFTGHGSDELRALVKSYGAHDLFTKPEFSSLEKAVHALLAKVPVLATAL